MDTRINVVVATAMPLSTAVLLCVLATSPGQAAGLHALAVAHPLAHTTTLAQDGTSVLAHTKTSAQDGTSVLAHTATLAQDGTSVLAHTKTSAQDGTSKLANTGTDRISAQQFPVDLSATSRADLVATRCDSVAGPVGTPCQ